MVKLQTELPSSSLNKVNSLNGGNQVGEEKENCQQTGGTVSMDLSLIEQVRHLVKREFDRNQEEQAERHDDKKQYSREHYEAIMDPKHPQTCWRYLMENELNVEQTIKQIKSNLLWRHQWGVDHINRKEFLKEFWLKAPIGFTGKTLDGLDIILAVGKDYKKPDTPIVKPLIKRFVLYLLAEWERKHQHDFEQVVLVCDVTDTTYRNLDLDFSSFLVGLREFFPYRVERIYIVGIPYLGRPIIRFIIGWLDERYAKKTNCIEWSDLVEGDNPVCSLDSVPIEAGGTADHKWRLAPSDVPWAADAKSSEYTDTFLSSLDSCIHFNTKNNQYEDRVRMQLEHEKRMK